MNNLSASALMAAFQFDVLCLEYSRSIESELESISSASTIKLIQLNHQLNGQSAEVTIKKMEETIAAAADRCYDTVSSRLSQLSDYARLQRHLAA